MIKERFMDKKKNRIIDGDSNNFSSFMLITNDTNEGIFGREFIRWAYECESQCNQCPFLSFRCISWGFLACSPWVSSSVQRQLTLNLGTFMLGGVWVTFSFNRELKREINLMVAMRCDLYALVESIFSFQAAFLGDANMCSLKRVVALNHPTQFRSMLITQYPNAR